MTISIPFSAACERNKDIILETISPYLCDVASVLEIGSGTGQHAIHFARALPQLVWQTSDRPEHLDGIRAQINNAGVSNARLPLQLDVRQTTWVANKQRFAAIFSANTCHIMTWPEIQAFFTGLQQVIENRAWLIIYGPFKYQGAFTSDSNREFDRALRAQNQGRAIRDFEAIEELANGAGFFLHQDVAMPANNQCLIFKHCEQ